MQELGRNTTITNLAIRDCLLSRENVQQLKALLRQNTVLQSGSDVEHSGARVWQRFL
jgi:hypothetical protein